MLIPAMLLTIGLISAPTPQSSMSGKAAARDSLDCAFDTGGSGVLAHRVSGGRLDGLCLLPEPGAVEPLPTGLIVPPGRYRFQLGDRLIAVSALRNGLYQVSVPGKGTLQFVVWNRRTGLEALMRDLAGLYAHGTRDDSATTAELLESARTRTLSATCGTVVNFLREVLRQVGVQSRRVLTTTTENLNGVDDGHILLEVRVGARWHLYDPDLGVRFAAGARALSAADLAAGRRATFNDTIRFYAPERRMAIDTGSLVGSDGFDFTFIEVRSRLSNATIERWYRRVLGLVAREIDGVAYYAVSGAGERDRVALAHPGAVFVTKEEFAAL